MAFGVDDLFLILGGISYKAIDGTRKLVAEGKNSTRIEFVQKYVRDNTDTAIERKIAEDVANPEKYEEVWSEIERFHRENPVVGWCRRYKGSSIICTPQFPNNIPHNFSVNDIGKIRLDFWSKAKNKKAYRAEMENIFYDYQEIAISLLMWIRGKETRSSARQNARMIYNEIVNKPSFPAIY